MNFFAMTLRGMLTYLFLLTLTRFMGRKLISQMTFFDFAIGVTMGTLAASTALGSKYTPLDAATVFVTMALLTVIIGIFHIHSFQFRKMIDSEPVTMIANGKIVEENLINSRLTLNEILMLLREKNVFNIADVEFAIMENDGQLSVQKKSQHEPLTAADLHLATGYKGLTKDVIMDGNILTENLADINLDEQWLSKELNSRGIDSISRVFYAGLDTSGNLYISMKQDGTEKPGQYGIE